MDFAESLTVQCDGLVVLDAPVPFTTELRDRPGRYTLQLSADRRRPLRDLAVRLAAPVGRPSLAPMGAELFVRAETTRPLRIETGPADGEAAAIHAATLPPVVRCEVAVVTRLDTELTAGTAGSLIVTLTHAYATIRRACVVVSLAEVEGMRDTRAHGARARSPYRPQLRRGGRARSRRPGAALAIGAPPHRDPLGRGRDR